MFELCLNPGGFQYLKPLMIFNEKMRIILLFR